MKIPVWKWILLHLTKTYVNFDTFGDYTSVIYMKRLFDELYVRKDEFYEKGKLVRSSKLTRIME